MEKLENQLKMEIRLIFIIVVLKDEIIFFNKFLYIL